MEGSAILKDLSSTLKSLNTDPYIGGYLVGKGHLIRHKHYVIYRVWYHWRDENVMLA